MSKKANSDEAIAWAREQLDRAISETIERGVFIDEVIEAKPVWVLHEKVTIGQAREASRPDSFVWIICGDLPTDHIGSSAAETPRDALRYFSLKWQMDADRYNDPAVRKAHGWREDQDLSLLTNQLVAKAEELYDIAEEESLWQKPALG
jgi:hypothetical protein